MNGTTDPVIDIAQASAELGGRTVLRGLDLDLGGAASDDPLAAARAALRLIHESRVELSNAEEKQINRFLRRFPEVPLTHVPSTRGGVTSLADLRGLARTILPALD